ncbi:MAG: hypothetical protein ACM3ZC_10275 [Bacteroidota bacterium]
MQPKGQATTDAFTVSIALNEAFATVPPDSFQITFAGKDVRASTIRTEHPISFPVGPGLRNGSYAVKLSTKAVPGWKEFKASWTIRLRNAPAELASREGPLTVAGSAAKNSADLDGMHLSAPVRARVSWDGFLLYADALCITPRTSALTLAETPIFGVKAGLELGPFGVELTEGVADMGSAETYPRFALATTVDLGGYALNLAAVVDDQSFNGPSIEAQQSYVASLSGELGGIEPGQAGASAEIACGLSFPAAAGEVDWALVQYQAGLPGADKRLKLLASLQPLLRAFPIPYADSSTLPETGLAYRLSAWGPIGKSAVRVEYARLADGFLSLGSPVLPGETAVLMLALDPERPATKPFTPDLGPVGDDPDGVTRTYGLHFTGLGFNVAGDPARLGFDYFRSEWAEEERSAKTYRLLVGYYTYADLDFVLEGGVDGGERFYGLEAAATRKIGHTTLALAGGYHARNDASSYGLGADLKYASGWGLLMTFNLLYGDPYGIRRNPARSRPWPE